MKKTNLTVNTIPRYILIIDLKYPGLFEQVYQIGDNNDEPASLYRLNYDAYGIKIE